MNLADIFKGRDLADHLEVPVITSTEASDRIIAAEREAEVAQAAVDTAEVIEREKLNKPRVERAREQLQTAEAELELAREEGRQYLREFRFTSLGSEAWEQLVLAHPPTKPQRERFGRDLDYNPDTFPLAAVAVCLTAIMQPDGTVEPVEHEPPLWRPDGSLDLDAVGVAAEEVRTTIKTRVKQAVWQQIWGGCHRVNVGKSQVPLSLSGSARPRSSDTGSEPLTS